jgi:hypothetical protein
MRANLDSADPDVGEAPRLVDRALEARA